MFESTPSYQWYGATNDVLYYNRACETTEYIEVIDVNDSKYVVLGDEPLSTKIIETDIGVLFIRWKWGEDDFDIENHLNEALLSDRYKIDSKKINMNSGNYILLDAAYDFIEGAGAVVSFQSAVNFVDDYIFNPNENNSFLIHAFYFDV